MIWFLFGAAISLACWDWSGGGGSRRFWLAAISALAAFGVSLTIAFPERSGECTAAQGLVCRAGFLLLAGLFVLSSAVVGIGTLYRRASGRCFAAFVLSDLCLLTAVWSHQSHTASWALPSLGGWDSAAGWGALAALLRLGAPLLASPEPASANAGSSRPGGLSEAALLSIGWWQGGLLAWSVGASGALVLAFGGLALWPAGAALARSRIGFLAAAGGLVAVGAALTADGASLAATGLAGVALALGEPVIGLWALSLLPLSALSSVDLASLFAGPGFFGAPRSGAGMSAAWLFGWAGLLPLAWFTAATRLKPPAPVEARLRLPGGLSGTLLASAGAAGAAVFASGSAEGFVWLLAGAALAVFAVAAVWRFPRSMPPKFEAAEPSQLANVAGTTVTSTPRQPTSAMGEAPPSEFPPPPGGFRRRWLAGVVAGNRLGWALFLLAVAAFGWLASRGMQTAFLG